MKILIIGSTQYVKEFQVHKKAMEAEGHIVKLPAFDDHEDLNELEICLHNRDLIKWADEVHIIWDRRSMGTIFDFGMTFALGKPIKIAFFEHKTFEGVMRKYERIGK